MVSTRKSARFFLQFAGYMLIALLVLSGCSSGGNESPWNDGTYTGEARGHNGNLKVSVEIADGKIASVQVDEHQETPGISDPAIERVTAAIVEEQSVEVDSVSGATYTSEAIKEAAAAALEQAAKE